MAPYDDPENIAKWRQCMIVEPIRCRRGIGDCYGSMYGNTERLAEVIAEEAAANGVREIAMHSPRAISRISFATCSSTRVDHRLTYLQRQPLPHGGKFGVGVGKPTQEPLLRLLR